MALEFFRHYFNLWGRRDIGTLVQCVSVTPIHDTDLMEPFIDDGDEKSRIEVGILNVPGRGLVTSILI